MASCSYALESADGPNSNLSSFNISHIIHKKVKNIEILVSDGGLEIDNMTI